MDTLHVGDRRKFVRTIEGDPHRVHMLVLYPDETVTVFSAVGINGEYEVEPPTFEQSSTHTLRWNVYADASDNTPSDSDEEELEVHPTPFAAPFEAP
jgi:hypothetical protein